jgi:hypothetical protein
VVSHAGTLAGPSLKPAAYSFVCCSEISMIFRRGVAGS